MTTQIDPDRWLAEYGDFLYRYALFKLGNAALAEDLTQETFLAALKARERFSGRSTERTWLTGILKHKIVDHLRRSGRETALEDGLSDSASLDAFFDNHGHWLSEHQAWNNPDQSLEQEKFWHAFRDCIAHLPPKLADLYILREINGVSSEEACKIVDISTTNNMWVMLSRARMRLRRCLESNWFAKAAGE
ncbi:MAG: sigma-70 family RNA polymerase sigma factor [Gammaproteobacteria bacterium]|nr:sigma-70 family RNA polymerase sigma factor [Gammaproteobacteria bacterium]